MRKHSAQLDVRVVEKQSDEDTAQRPVQISCAIRQNFCLPVSRLLGRTVFSPPSAPSFPHSAQTPPPHPPILNSLKKSAVLASSFNFFSRACKSLATPSNSLLDFFAAAR